MQNYAVCTATDNALFQLKQVHLFWLLITLKEALRKRLEAYKTVCTQFGSFRSLTKLSSETLRKAASNSVACYPDNLEAALAEKLKQFAAIFFSSILDKQQLILIKVTENVWNWECICLLWKTSCTLLLQIQKLSFSYTCASCFPTDWRAVFF